jgi:hypothetical protein
MNPGRAMQGRATTGRATTDNGSNEINQKSPAKEAGLLRRRYFRPLVRLELKETPSA